MIEIAALGPARPALVENATPLTPAAPAAEAVAAWQTALAPPTAASAPPAVPATPTDLRAAVLQAYPLPAAAETGLGDRILGGLQGVQQRFDAQLQAVSRTLDGTPSTSELLRLQLGMAQMAFQVELVGKAISRGTQNIDQLLRMQ